jgi:hypothetical protein
MQEQEGRAAIERILRKNSQEIVKPSQQTNPDWKMVAVQFEGTRDRRCRSHLEGFKLCSEVSEKRRLVSKFQAAELLPLVPES